MTTPPPITPEHFTAWLTMDRSALDTDYADVVVLRDELRGEPDDPQAWTTAAGEPEVFKAITTVHAKEGTADDAIRQAEELLAAAGWEVGDWDGVESGYVATVSRA